MFNTMVRFCLNTFLIIADACEGVNQRLVQVRTTPKHQSTLIRLQRIYNLWSIHVVILSFLDVLQSFYRHFISFFGTNLLTQCPVPVACFLHRRKSISDGVQMPRQFMMIFYGPKDRTWAKEVPEGCPEGGTTHLGAPGGPGAPWWVVPISGAPGWPLYSVNTPIF